MSVFVIATRRQEFARVWEKILNKHGKVRIFERLDELRQFLRAHAVQLAMLDLELPDSRDPATLRALVQDCAHGKLMLGGIRFAPNAELAGLATGAVACCSPDLPVAECKRMVEVILGGGIWLSSTGIPALVERLRNLGAAQSTDAISVAPAASEDSGISKLTRREREVAELVGLGANNKIIARKLLITDRTVKAHLTAIYSKLNITDRLQLALRMSRVQMGAQQTADG